MLPIELLSKEEACVAIGEWPSQIMKPWDVQMVLDHFTMPNWMQAQWRVDGRESNFYRGYSVILQVHVPDRDTGELIELRMQEFLPLCDTESRLQQYARAFLVCLVTHEVDEHLLYNGVRIFDPHHGELP